MKMNIKLILIMIAFSFILSSCEALKKNIRKKKKCPAYSKIEQIDNKKLEI